jgi:serine/threonine protein kinase
MYYLQGFKEYITTSHLPSTSHTFLPTQTHVSLPPYTPLTYLTADNIVFDGDGNALLIDFGNCTFKVPFVALHKHCMHMSFMPPDLLLGNLNYDYAVDIWALGTVSPATLHSISSSLLIVILSGILLVYMLSKQELFSGNSPHEQLEQMQEVYDLNSLKIKRVYHLLSSLPPSLFSSLSLIFSCFLSLSCPHIILS